MSQHKRGRPPLSPDEESTGVSVKMPVGLYDRLYQAAEEARVSIPEVVRRAIRRELNEQRPTFLET